MINLNKNTREKICLVNIRKSDYKFLYDLLLERQPKTNIKHSITPLFTEHLQFVKSKPYSKWYVIIDEDKNRLGTIYLTKENEVGIFIKKKYMKKGIGNIALQTLIQKNPKSRYIANINPKNQKSKIFFKKNGFKSFQISYELVLN